MVIRSRGLERLEPTFMTRIESPLVALNADCATVASDIRHWEGFGSLLAEGPVTDFKWEGDACSFKVAGGVGIHLERTSDGTATEGSVLTLATKAPTPVKFTLDVVLTPYGEGCTFKAGCDAELNPFTKMMVEPALEGLFGKMAEALQSRF